jgi:hypothetical protein
MHGGFEVSRITLFGVSNIPGQSELGEFMGADLTKRLPTSTLDLWRT